LVCVHWPVLIILCLDGVRDRCDYILIFLVKLSQYFGFVEDWKSWWIAFFIIVIVFNILTSSLLLLALLILVEGINVFLVLLLPSDLLVSQVVCSSLLSVLFLLDAVGTLLSSLLGKHFSPGDLKLTSG
jgi:hypothetical protein